MTVFDLQVRPKAFIVVISVWPFTNAGQSVYWQSIFQNSPDPTFVLLTYLWHAMYGWDEALEDLYVHICSLVSIMPFPLHHPHNIPRKLVSLILRKCHSHKNCMSFGHIISTTLHCLMILQKLCTLSKILTILQWDHIPATSGSLARWWWRGSARTCWAR